MNAFRALLFIVERTAGFPLKLSSSLKVKNGFRKPELPISWVRTGRKMSLNAACRSQASNLTLTGAQPGKLKAPVCYEKGIIQFSSIHYGRVAELKAAVATLRRTENRYMVATSTTTLTRYAVTLYNGTEKCTHPIYKNCKQQERKSFEPAFQYNDRHHIFLETICFAR